jgi:hypothetical protein
MNTLAFRITDENGMSFELLVDGRPLGELVGAQNWAIPYWDVVDDLPHDPPHGKSVEPEIRIVCCCSCGYYGCGHTQCRVVREGSEVVFRDFDFDASREGRRQVFRFPADNYAAVVSEMVALVRAQQTQAERVAAPDRPRARRLLKHYRRARVSRLVRLVFGGELSPGGSVVMPDPDKSAVGLLVLGMAAPGC